MPKCFECNKETNRGDYCSEECENKGLQEADTDFNREVLVKNQK